MIEENASIDEIRTIFENDRFATQAAGCIIVEAKRGHAVCEMPLAPIHRNAAGGIMGGAIFTLADFALAVASNVGESPTVSAMNTIEFMNSVKGEKLIACCDVDKSGRRLGFYTVEVRDDTGRAVAKMTAACAR